MTIVLLWEWLFLDGVELRIFTSASRDACGSISSDGHYEEKLHELALKDCGFLCDCLLTRTVHAVNSKELELFV